MARQGTSRRRRAAKAAATSTAYGNTAAGKTSNGDMYAGHDGNVYKNTGSGWQTYNNGSWNNVQKPTTTSAQSYDQQHPDEYESELFGDQQKAQSYNQQRPSGASGYKPSGGSYGDVNQEAQDRARGAEQSQRFSQYQHSGGGAARPLGRRGGDRWGGASRGGGGWGGRR